MLCRLGDLPSPAVKTQTLVILPHLKQKQKSL
jgi:hypothetical protein